MEGSETRSLVIMDPGGKILDLGDMNEKAFKKTLENKILWVIHTDTGRVLPYKGECRINSIQEAPFGYMAYLAEGEHAKSPGVQENDKTGDSPGVLVTESGERSKGTEILYRLADIISDRHKEMPEGSYTTHLFNSGPDKIRKKLGEEAVEVILARDSKDVVYESADLIYHLLVLLESLDITLDEVFRELENRE